MTKPIDQSLTVFGERPDGPASCSRRLALAALFALAPLVGVAQAAGDAPVAEVSTPAQDAAGPLTILYCGDSLAQGLYLATQPPLRRRANLRLVNGTRHATGITRSDEFDWVTAVRDQVERSRPGLMVAWIGANDFRSIVDRASQRRYQFGTAGFAEAYAARMTAMTESARAVGAAVAWIGLPNMRAAAMAESARRLNEIQQQAALAAGALWLPTWAATSDATGQFRPSIPGADHAEHRFRADDGVHFSDLGYRRIASLAFAAIAAEKPDMAPPLAAASETLEGQHVG
jgi:hypothetical protein